MRKTEKKKGPLIAVWIAIVVMGINQMLSVRHEYQMHQMMREEIANLQQDILEMYDREDRILQMIGSLMDSLTIFEKGKGSNLERRRSDAKSNNKQV